MNDSSAWWPIIVAWAGFAFATVGALIGALWATWRIEGKARLPRPMDVVKIDGQYQVVHSIEWRDGEQSTLLLGLDDTLGRTLAVRGPEGSEDLMTLQDAMLSNGWMPPFDHPEWFRSRTGGPWIDWREDQALPAESVIGIISDPQHIELVCEAIERLPQNIWTTRMQGDLRRQIERVT